MALTSWKGKIVRKQDIIVAKNYLISDELDTLNRLVTIFLETAELRTKNRKSITMDFWKENVDKIIVQNDRPLLQDRGAVSKTEMENKVKDIYLEFDSRRKKYEAEEEDRLDLDALEKDIKFRNKS